MAGKKALRRHCRRRKWNSCELRASRSRVSGMRGQAARAPRRRVNMYGIIEPCCTLAVSDARFAVGNRSGERSPAGVAGLAAPAKPLEPPGAALLLQTNPPERLHAVVYDVRFFAFYRTESLPGCRRCSRCLVHATVYVLAAMTRRSFVLCSTNTWYARSCFG